MTTIKVLENKTITMEHEENYPTKTERIDELFKEVQRLNNRINILETEIQIMRMDPAEPVIYGPSGGLNPPILYDELNIVPKVIYPTPFIKQSKRIIEGKPYDLKAHGGPSKLKKGK